METQAPPEARNCPLCGRTVDDATDLRVHLMCNHRKSELTDELLGRFDALVQPA